MHIKCRYFSRKNLATGEGGGTPQMPLTVKYISEPHFCKSNVKINWSS